MYVNLLTRRPDHFNFRNSTKLQNFVAANEIIFRLYGKLNNDDLKASEKYYSLRFGSRLASVSEICDFQHKSQPLKASGGLWPM